MAGRVSYQEISRRIREMAEAEFGRGASEEQIRKAEQLLGIVFPPSYKMFLQEFGWASIGSEEIYGLGNDVPSHLDLVRNTFKEREAADLPNHLIPISEDGFGNLDCLDTSRWYAGECPIVWWKQCPEEGIEELADNFVEWMLEYILTEAESDLPEGIKLEELEPIPWAEHRRLHRQQRELKRLREAWEQATIPWPKPPPPRQNIVDTTPMTRIEAITDEALRQMAAEAKSFLLGHRWCQSVRQGYLDRAWPGVLAIFYFEIIPAPYTSADDAVWVIVGDLPPAYIDSESCEDGIAALEGYVGAMWGWVEAVKEGRSVEEEIPVYYRHSFLEVPPTLEFALMLEQRLRFIEEHFLPPVASEGGE